MKSHSFKAKYKSTKLALEHDHQRHVHAYLLHKRGLTYKAIGEDLGVCKDRARQIVQGVIWHQCLECHKGVEAITLGKKWVYYT